MHCSGIGSAASATAVATTYLYACMRVCLGVGPDKRRDGLKARGVHVCMVGGGGGKHVYVNDESIVLNLSNAG